MNQVIPDFLIVGAAKSGTTSLIAGLKQHPDIYTPGVELNYFSHFYNKGVKWYSSQFLHPEKVQGEKSTSYLYETSCHQRIFDHNPGIKLIILLREPFKRAFSNWTMRYNQSRLLKQAHLFNGRNQPKIENIGFSHLFNYYVSCPSATIKREEPLDIFERGMYIDQIQHLRGIFPSEQLLILISERYFNHPAETLRKVSRFLNIGDFPENCHAWKRKTEYPVKLDEAVVRQIRNFYKPFNERLFEFLGGEIEEWRT
ncbi:MAG: sulfotransferase domain-containing protein [Bacteroidetes bacterium]|nr:sulfotransferase domain-containing protein [Bacteroidota bacterium]